ncbi:hypothetical protein C8J57DRAFT_1483139 [Mycena rebaudengoi]|nr:hypothetical protein C8J57DRAFT_1483139 [Mycena rebaudengoi]
MFLLSRLILQSFHHRPKRTDRPQAPIILASHHITWLPTSLLPAATRRGTLLSGATAWDLSESPYEYFDLGPRTRKRRDGGWGQRKSRTRSRFHIYYTKLFHVLYAARAAESIGKPCDREVQPRNAARNGPAGGAGRLSKALALQILLAVPPAGGGLALVHAVSRTRVEPEPRWVLLEEWVLRFASSPSSSASSASSSASSTSSTDNGGRDEVLLPTIYKNAIPLFRALFALLRILPAWRVVRKLAGRGARAGDGRRDGDGDGGKRRGGRACASLVESRRREVARCGAGETTLEFGESPAPQTGATPFPTSTHVFPGIAHPAGSAPCRNVDLYLVSLLLPLPYSIAPSARHFFAHHDSISPLPPSGPALSTPCPSLLSLPPVLIADSSIPGTLTLSTTYLTTPAFPLESLEALLSSRFAVLDAHDTTTTAFNTAAAPARRPLPSFSSSPSSLSSRARVPSSTSPPSAHTHLPTAASPRTPRPRPAPPRVPARSRAASPRTASRRRTTTRTSSCPRSRGARSRRRAGRARARGRPRRLGRCAARGVPVGAWDARTGGLDGREQAAIVSHGGARLGVQWERECGRGGRFGGSGSADLVDRFVLPRSGGFIGGEGSGFQAGRREKGRGRQKQFAQLNGQSFNVIDLKQFAIQRGAIEKKESGSLDVLADNLLGAYLSRDN